MPIERSRLFDVCGNRLLVALCDESDAALRAKSEAAAACFRDGARISDGIACFAKRAGFVRSVFFNPDGSFERVCGNSLLAAAALFAEPSSPAMIRPFDYPDVTVTAHADGSIQASGILEIEPRPSTLGGAPLYDTGSPHAVLEVPDARSFELDRTARAASESLNVTVFSSAAQLVARTFERGVMDETGSCGTGAIAVALAHGRYDEPVQIAYPGGTYFVLLERSAKRARWTLRVAPGSVRAL